jgi:hypothetical protein
MSPARVERPSARARLGPSVSTPVAIKAWTFTVRPASRTFRTRASAAATDVQGPASSGRVRKPPPARQDPRDCHDRAPSSADAEVSGQVLMGGGPLGQGRKSWLAGSERPLCGERDAVSTGRAGPSALLSGRGFG